MSIFINLFSLDRVQLLVGVVLDMPPRLALNCGNPPTSQVLGLRLNYKIVIPNFKVDREKTHLDKVIEKAQVCTNISRETRTSVSFLLPTFKVTRCLWSFLFFSEALVQTS